MIRNSNILNDTHFFPFPLPVSIARQRKKGGDEGQNAHPRIDHAPLQKVNADIKGDDHKAQAGDANAPHDKPGIPGAFQNPDETHVHGIH